MFSAIRRLVATPWRWLVHSSRPTPSTVLQLGPAASYIPRSSKTDRDAAVALCKLLDLQLLQGRQLGVQVAVFRDGEQVLSVCAGVCRTRTCDEWQPVTPETRFMPWSVSKGIAAAALLSCVDRGLVAYEKPVADVWPAFAANGKQSLSVQDAVSHRIATTGLPTLSMLYDGRHDMARLWARGLKFVEHDTPPPPKRKTPRAAYVPVTWSWVMGGIVQGASGGKHIHDVVRDDLGKPLGVEDELLLGCFPSEKAQVLSKAEMPRARTLLLPRGVWDVLSWKWAWRVAAFAESVVLVNAANSDFLRLHCLPSSNGFFTASAVAKVYAALANNGKADDVQLFSSKIVADLVASVGDVTQDAVNPKHSRPDKRARMSRGFNPWSNSALHGKNARTVLGHSGICGSTAFGDPKSGLSLAIFHTQYQPLLVAHAIGGTGEATLEISQTILNAYGLAAEGAQLD